MAGPEQYLARWRDAGLIDAALMQRILYYEALPPVQTAADADERPGVVEALLYLGVAIALVGIVALTSNNWGALNRGTRLATVGVPAGLALFAGLFMCRTPDAQLRRAAGIAWLAGVVLLGGTAAVAGVELGWKGHWTVLAASVCASVLALTLWRANPSRSQMIALAGSGVFLAESVAGQWSPYRPEIAGLLILLCGATGILLTERNHLRPHGFAAALSGLLVVAGALHAQPGIDAFWAGLPLLTAGAILIGLSLQRGAFTYLLAGVLATFLGLVLFIFQHFASTIGVPAALLLTGCLLVGGVLFVSAWRRRLRRNSIA